MDLLSAPPSVSQLTFDANKTITITSTAAGGGQLTLDNGSSPAAVVVSGSGHAIDSKVAIALDSDAWITTSGSGDSLSIAGQHQQRDRRPRHRQGRPWHADPLGQ